MNTTPPVAFNLDNLLVRPRTAVSKEDWDAFVNISPQAWLNHTYDLQDAISTWPGKNDLSFALVDGIKTGSIAAVLPLHRMEKPFLNLFPNCSLESNGALAFHPDLSARQVSRVADLMKAELHRLGRINHAEEIIFTIPPMAPAFRGQHCPKVNPLISHGMENTLSQTYVIDLRRLKVDIWVTMEKRARNAIRKAEKCGVIVREAAAGSDLDIYYDLHCKTYHRTGVPPHPRAYFESIWQHFLPTGVAKIFFAEFEGEVVAAENFGVFKNAAIYWTGAASEIGLDIQANSYLQWTAIQWMLQQGLDWYETGEGFPNLREGKRKGLNDFKKSFGGQLFPLYRGRILLKEKLYRLIQVSKSLKTILQASSINPVHHKTH